MEFRVLGPVEVVESGRVIDLGGARATSLVAALLAHRGEVVAQDTLAEAIWPDSDRARANLQSYVARIRRELGPEGKSMVARTETGYVLHAEVDADRFENLLRQGMSSLSDDPAGAAELAERALDIWRGPAFGRFAGDELVAPEAARLDGLRVVAREHGFEAELALGRHRELVGEIEQMCNAHPLRERLWELLMLALVRSGRQADALRAYQQARQKLAEDLGIEPSERLRQLEQMVLDQDPGLDIGPAPRADAQPRQEMAPATPPLPSDMTPFVGRETEIEQVAALLEESRLVTLTGFGGVGKTRLAIQVARTMEPRSPGGVAIAELADVATATEIETRIDDAFGSVGDEPALVIIDNCEHVIDSSAAEIARRILHQPSCRVLATSREPLRIPGEVRWRVEPMTPPEADAPAEQLAQNAAIRLFLDRVRAIRPELSFDDDALAEVADICRRLDGIPLAIELAAAQIGAMGLSEIRRGLAARFSLLTEGFRTAPPRQQTLAGAFDWSYDLLDTDERRLLEQIRPLPAGFTRRAAEVLCASTPDEEGLIGSRLARLADRSLVNVESRDGEASFSILPTIQEFIYARGWQSVTSPDVTDALPIVRVENRGFLVHLAQRTEPRLRGTIPEMWAALTGGPTDIARQAIDLAYYLHDLEPGSFLAGVVAARTSQSGRVGFIGGVRAPYIHRFEVGFVAGVRHVDDEIEVDVDYLGEPPDLRGFMEPEPARRRALELFENDVDVVFHAAGIWAGGGVYEGARQHHLTHGHRPWVIGVDFDERMTRDPEHRPYVLTSMRRQIPRQTYLAIKAAVTAGTPEDAPHFDLANEGVGVSDTGGTIDHLMDEIDAIRAEIIAGAIEVPRVATSGEDSGSVNWTARTWWHQ